MQEGTHNDTQTTTPEGVLEVFERVEGPGVILSGDVAEHLMPATASRPTDSDRNSRPKTTGPRSSKRRSRN